MVMRILENSPETRIYHENHATAFVDFELRPDPVLRALVGLNPAPVQVFKPICDSQDADSILARWPAARGLWVYRHPDDVANSAAEKWGEHQRQLVQAVVRGDLDTWGWRTRRLPRETVENLRRVYRPDLTPAEGALLFWYMRNSFFFALELHQHPRMRLVQYEHLVTEPRVAFGAMFAHLGATFSDDYVSRVRSDSVGRREAPPSSPEIRALCLDLVDRMDAYYAAQAAATRLPSPVLILINTLGVGGAERYVATTANWLAEHGANVHVASSGGDLVRALDARVNHHEVDLYRVRGALGPAALSVRRLLDACPPEAIICHSLAVTWVARLASAGRGIPVVNVAHGWPADRYATVGKLMCSASQVVAVSDDVRDKLVAGGLEAARCVVVRNGVDLRGLGPRSGEARDRARTAMGGGDFIVLSVGRVTAQKAHHHLVELSRRCPEVRFALAGEGPLLDELSRQAQGSNVTLMGLRHDVPELLGSADAYLSTSDWEGMSLTLIEAMASGLPCVATATEGSRELLAGGAGALVPVGDVAAMTEAIERVRAGQRFPGAQARAQADYGHERMCRELGEVLAGLRATPP